MISRRVLTFLITAACVLPVAIVILLAVARLLGAMDDKAAGSVVDRVALAAGILWAIDLVCLVIAQGINSLGPPSSAP
jgi:Na+/melibiose symporter-like transporter